MNSATIKQIGYLMYLLETQGIVNSGKDLNKFEEIVKIRIFDMNKKQASEYIEKLKEDSEWMKMVTDIITGSDQTTQASL